MTGNGNHTTSKNGDDLGMVYYCFTHITWVIGDYELIHGRERYKQNTL